MAVLAPPVQVVASGAPPFVNVPSGAPPFVAVTANAPPITIVASGAPPITLFNPDGSIWTGGAGTTPVGGAALLTDETNAIGIDFAYSDDAKNVAVKTAGTVIYSSVDTQYQNGATTPKMVFNSSGLLVWAPHNMFLNSAAPATQTVTTLVGAPYIVTVTGSGSMVGSVGASGTATQAAPLTYVATTVASTFTLSGSLTQIQMNRGTVATAYLATAGSRAYGVPIDYDPVIGRSMLVEHGSTNICLWSDDLTNAVWVKTTMTTALTVGPTGIANSATTLTATGANATALQTITNASAARITSVFLKRRTGSGNVDITQDNGTTWATQTITSSWARYVVAEATILNPVVGIRLVTSGDAVDVAIFQNEVSTIAHVVSSPMPTYAALFGRAADNLTFLLSTIPALGSEYSIYVRFAIPNPAFSAQCAVALTDGTANEQSKLALSAAAAPRLLVIDGGVTGGQVIGTAVPVANTLLSLAGRFRLNDCAMSQNGGTVGTDTTVTLPTVTETRYGNAGTNAISNNVFRITKLVIVTDRGWDNATLITKSAT